MSFFEAMGSGYKPPQNKGKDPDPQMYEDINGVICRVASPTSSIESSKGSTDDDTTRQTETFTPKYVSGETIRTKTSEHIRRVCQVTGNSPRIAKGARFQVHFCDGVGGFEKGFDMLFLYPQQKDTQSPIGMVPDDGTKLAVIFSRRLDSDDDYVVRWRLLPS